MAGMDFDEAIEPEAGRGHTRPAIWLALGGLAGLGFCLTALFFALRGPERGLRPFRGDPTTIAFIIDGQPVLVTFPELSENAAAYHNQRIRVTGFYLPLAPATCNPHTGPLFHWSLVSEGLQLNAQGFDRPLSLVAPGTTLTVEGVWRLYYGPAGCGKEPETGNLWYLQVERIVQPNPLSEGTRDPAAYLLSGVSTPIFPTIGPTNTPRAGASTTPTLMGTHTSTPTQTPPGTAVTGTPTFTPTGGATAATPTRLSTTPTGTRPSGTVTPTPTGTLTVTPGATPTRPPQPTNPNPYPGPGNTPPAPTATPTPGY